MSRALRRALAHLEDGVTELGLAKGEIPEVYLERVTRLRASAKVLARHVDELRREIEVAGDPPPAA